MKPIKKFIKLVLVMLVVFVVSLVRVNVLADSTTYDDANKYNYTTVSEKTTYLSSDVTMIKNTGYTTRNKVKYDQRVTVFKADFSGSDNIKIATWAIPNTSNTGFTRNNLVEIAKNYEENNPGWIVLGGINADQYFPSFGTGVGTNGTFYYTPQPYYPMITNGDNLFTITATGYSNKVIGFKNDGSTEPFVNGKRSVEGMFVYVYDENKNFIEKFKADGLNCELGENKIVVLSPYVTSSAGTNTISKTTEEIMYVIGNADMSYVSNTVKWADWNPGGAIDAFFGKGYVTDIKNTVYLKNNQFAIQTSNMGLIEKLKEGCYVKVQYDFDSEMDGIEEAMGYHTVQKKDGVDQNVDNSYNTRAYPRSLVGCDAEGNVYLMTCFGDNSAPTKGLYAQEANAFFKQYGITDAFQMDGGGSVTSVYRNELGEIVPAEADIENSHKNKDTPTYSGYRYILSGLFVVMKVDEIPVETNISDTSCKLIINNESINEKYAGATMEVRINKVGEEEYKSYPIHLDRNVNEISLTSLEPDTEYTYELYYQNAGERTKRKTYIASTFRTNKANPVFEDINFEIKNGKWVISFNYDDPAKTIVKLYAYVNGRKNSFDFIDGYAKLTLDKLGTLDYFMKAECALSSVSNEKTEIDIEGNMKFSSVASAAYAVECVNDMVSKLLN